MIDLRKVPFVGASDNYTKGRNGVKVAAIVIHVMAGTQGGTRSWFNNPRADVSAHFGVSGAGDIDQYVSTDDTAWHSGSWAWNLKSIGIEHEGRPPGWMPTTAQLQASVQLAAALCRKYSIQPSPATIIPHVQINPLHACPSSGFPMAMYIADIVKALDSPLPSLQRGHVTEVECPLYDPIERDNSQVGTVTIIKGTDKAYLKSLTRKAVWRTGRPTAESYGTLRLFDPQSNKQIGTLSLVLNGPQKAYINGLNNDALPR